MWPDIIVFIMLLYTSETIVHTKLYESLKLGDRKRLVTVYLRV